MRITDSEIQEWHEHLYAQRNKFQSFIENIVIGIPTIAGMASPYRQMNLKEIKEEAERLLNEYK